jgi:hypothetical protein
MNNNWFCKRQPLPIIISALFFLAIGLITPGPVVADTPAWLRSAARETYPNVPPETEAVILFDEQEITVQSNGEVDTIYRRAYLILRPGGKGYGRLVIPFDTQRRLSWVKAWCIPKEGKDYEVKEKDALETGFGEEFYSDIHYKILEIPAATPGNVVGYEYRQKTRPFILQDEWWIQHSIPTRRSRFTLNLPSTWEHSEHWIHYAVQKPTSESPTQISWEVENILPIKDEPAMPVWQALVARMGVTYHPPTSGGSVLGPSNWGQIGIWSANLAAGSLRATPEIQLKVKELTASASTWRAKVDALTSYVQAHVRYVAIEIGIGGYQPHAAGDIYRYQYGDCKDKAALLSTMLHEVGIESYLALAQTERGIVTPEFASAITFNHAILAIRVPEGEDVKNLPTVVNTSKLGKLLFFDPTATYTPLGTLPSPLQENYVLVAASEGGELVRLPLLSPDTNRLTRHAKLELRSDGSLTGDVEEVRSGAEATNERAMLLHASGAERTKALENFLGSFLRGFHLTDATVNNLEKTGEPLGLKYQFTADRYAKSAGDLLVLRPRVLGEKAVDLSDSETRKYPFQFDEASLQTDDFEITLPPGFAVEDVPPPTKTENEFASYTSQIQVAGNKIHYTRTYQVKQVLVPAEKIEEFRKFNRQIAGDERSSVVLRHGSQ